MVSINFFFDKFDSLILKKKQVDDGRIQSLNPLHQCIAPYTARLHWLPFDVSV